MENQNNNLQELEELRSQVAEFKNRMEQQEIVSRRRRFMVTYYGRSTSASW